MKKNCLLLMLLVCVMLLTGCSMEERIGVVVDKNKDVSMEAVVAMDNELIDTYLSMSEESSEDGEDGEEPETKTYTDAERWAYLDSTMKDGEDNNFTDFSELRYESGEMKGYRYSRKLGKIDDITLEGSASEISFSELTDQSKLFTKKGSTYTLKIKNDDSDDTSDAEQMEDNGADVVMEFYVTLPEKAIKHNATSVSKDGKTYTWNLLKTQDIEISFKVGKGMGVLPIIIIIAVIVAIVIIAKKNSANKGDTSYSDYTPNTTTNTSETTINEVPNDTTDVNNTDDTNS